MKNRSKATRKRIASAKVHKKRSLEATRNKEKHISEVDKQRSINSVSGGATSGVSHVIYAKKNYQNPKEDC